MDGYDEDYVPGEVSYDGEEYPDEFYDMYPDGLPSTAETGVDAPIAIADNGALNDNLPDILKCAKNSDIGFESIIRRAKLFFEGDKVILEFSEDFSYDVAVNSGYAKVMTAALSEYYKKDITAVIKKKGKLSSAVADENAPATDPLDDILKLADENQLIFDIND